MRARALLVPTLLSLVITSMACEPKAPKGASSTSTKGTTPISGETGAATKSRLSGEQEVLLAEAKKLLEESGSLKEAHFEVLMLDLASCELDEKRGFIKSDCPAMKRMSLARTRPNRYIQNMSSMWSRVGQEHLTHESPAVRLFAVQMLGMMFSKNSAGQKLMLQAAREETSPPVLLAQIRVSRNVMGANPGHAEFVLKSSESKSDVVRREALLVMTSSWAIGADGTLERALEMIDSDPSMEVRQQGCANLGGRADDRAIPILEKYTAWPAVEKELYHECFRGLVDMWASSAVHKRPSKAAYELTMSRVEATPRGEDNPSWKAIGAMGIGHDETFRSRAPWYQPERVEAALVSMIKDSDFHWLGRRAAIDAYARSGVSSDKVAALYKGAFNEGLVKKDTTQHEAFLAQHMEKRLREVLATEAIEEKKRAAIQEDAKNAARDKETTPSPDREAKKP